MCFYVFDIIPLILLQSLPRVRSPQLRFHRPPGVSTTTTTVDWNMFRDSADNINELTTSITGFIRKCIGHVIPTVRVPCFPYQNKWINTKVVTTLKDRATAHRAIVEDPEATTEDRNKYTKSRYDLCRVIKGVKGQYWDKVESYYTGSVARHMCQGLQSTMDYKGRPSSMMPLYQMNSMHLLHASTITTLHRV